MIDKLHDGWNNIAENVILTIGAIPLLVGVAFANVEIVRRYFLGGQFHWSNDFVTYIILSGIFIAFCVGQAKRAHFNVTLVVEILQARGKETAIKFIRFLYSLISLAFASMMVYYAWPAIMRTMERGTRTESLIFPLWIFQFVMWVGFILFAITALVQTLRDFNVLTGRSQLVIEEELEDAKM